MNTTGLTAFTAGASFAAAAILTTGAALACGPDSDCIVGERTYRIAMPAGHDGTTPVGAIVHSHGYRGTARGVMRNKAYRNLASKLGVALIATKSSGDDWALPGAPSAGVKQGIDELAYYDRVIADAAARYPIDQSRLMATGFSAGGMMVWNLICGRGDMFAGFAPYSGTFWKPEPETCTSPPASVVHIHGNADPTVPLTGRAIAKTHQGDVGQVLAMYADYGGFAGTETYRAGRLSCSRKRNHRGKILDFCLFEGGHAFIPGFIRHAWNTLMEK